MLVSTRGRYALRVLVDIAQQSSDAFVPLHEIALRQGISEKYLEAIVKALVQSGFLNGMRGKGGGYRLSRTPSQIPVSEVLKTTEGDIAPVACLEDGAAPCERASDCLTLSMWQGLDEVISDYLSKYTIEDLAFPNHTDP